MKITTQQFGEIEFEKGHIVNFSSGLIGFENLKEYLLIKTDDELFYWLNSIEKPDICFPMVGIRVIDEDFPMEKDFEAFGIVTLNKDPLKVTINLKSPVYLNQDEKTGYQKMLADSKYSVNYNLFKQ
ncbi:MAG: flagellar assembly protein FliW [Ignavibacteriaceae bacterium]|jgi:flagellar assembly factor FliW